MFCFDAAARAKPSSPASPADTAPNTLTKEARARWDEGMRAVDAQDYEAARIAFQQAYAIKQHPEVLRNLALAELKTERILSGARHLAEYLRIAVPSDAERESLLVQLRAAENELSRLEVRSDQAGAVVSVDGEIIGRTPVASPWYLTPGQHEIVVQKSGYTEHRAEISTPKAGVYVHEVSLAALPSSTPAHTPPAVLPSDRPHRQAPSSQLTKVFVIGAAGVLTVTAGSLWAGFALKGSAKEDAERRLMAQVGEEGCQTPSTSVCRDLEATARARADANDVAQVARVSTLVMAAATASLWLFWPDQPERKTTFRIAPSARPSGGSLDVYCTF